jgi:hypothetical protein
MASLTGRSLSYVHSFATQPNWWTCTAKAGRSQFDQRRGSSAAARRSCPENEALHIVLVAPFLQQPVKGVEAGPIGLAQMRPEQLFALVVVIAGRAFSPEVPVGDRCIPDGPDPVVLGLLAGFHGCGSAGQRFLDDMGDVSALLLEHRGRVSPTRRPG